MPSDADPSTLRSEESVRYRDMTSTHERDESEVAGIGASRAFRDVIEQARDLARIPRPILIRGERGTGKELLARFVHAASRRRGKPYLIVNCGAFQDELLMSHLFGHERGAFTGATERRVGIFPRAGGLAWRQPVC